MKHQNLVLALVCFTFVVVSSFRAVRADDEGPGGSPSRRPDGDGTVTVSGAMRVWHKIALTLDGPFADERDDEPNPFLDYRMTARFSHASGDATFDVPGYFAADGDAANSSATSGTKWRAHFAPDRPGQWRYAIAFVRGSNVAVELESLGSPVEPFDGVKGGFTVKPSDKSGRDLRGKGRLSYAGKHHLRFANGEYFLKVGADAPENLLAYEDFDATPNHGKRRRSYGPHVRDWRPGDPTWKDGKGKGLIGAVNYLSSKGMNVFSFLTYSHNGDDKNVFPHVDPEKRRRMDCSKLDQWEIVFEHADRMGMYLHFKTQETENDQDMDGGALGVERKLYYRELVARFGHHLALNWNLGEENTNSAKQCAAFTRFFHAVDPYHHNVVVHTFPNKKEQVYAPLLGEGSLLTGASLQSCPKDVHDDTLEWRRRSASAGRPWVVANDEQCPANTGVKPDKDDASHDTIRIEALWGNLMAGGAGVELYFGYKFAHSDLTLQDFRSRDIMWDQCRYALEFFEKNGVPFHDMEPRDDLVSGKGVWCLAGEGQYVLHVRNVRESAKRGAVTLDLSDANGEFELRWHDPKRGGKLRTGSVESVQGGARRDIGDPPDGASGDRVVLVRPARR